MPKFEVLILRGAPGESTKHAGLEPLERRVVDAASEPDARAVVLHELERRATLPDGPLFVYAQPLRE